jgi:hypothetical protein
MPRHVAYWLVPAAPALTFFQELIETLARTYSAPVFVPHVTLYAGESPPGEAPLAVLDAAIGQVSEVCLQVIDLRYTAAFTKTLFIQLQPSELLARLTVDLRRLSARPSAYMLDPHLSLLYQSISESAKHHLATTIRLPMSTICFDEVWAILSPGPTHTTEDVRGWEVVCRKSLVKA